MLSGSYLGTSDVEESPFMNSLSDRMSAMHESSLDELVEVDELSSVSLAREPTFLSRKALW